MASGAAHYTDAERLLRIAEQASLSPSEKAVRVAAAQVHATLAQAAALIEQQGHYHSTEWREATA